MRIATWNINGVRARLEFLQRWLADRKPDIVGLQELKAEDDKFPWDEISRSGYHAHILPQKAWNGVAVLTRQPCEVTQLGLPGFEEAGSRLIAVRTGDLHFVTVYCPNGKSIDHPDFGAKLAWFDGLQDFIEDRYSPDDRLILCGDFNVVPAAVDSWSEDMLEGGIFHTVAERRRIERLLDWGLGDVWRAHNPTKPGFTWWDYRGNGFKKQRGLRIDFLLATTAVRDDVRFVHPDAAWRESVDDMTPSDHAPVYMDTREDA